MAPHDSYTYRASILREREVIIGDLSTGLIKISLDISRGASQLTFRDRRDARMGCRWLPLSDTVYQAIFIYTDDLHLRMLIHDDVRLDEKRLQCELQLEHTVGPGSGLLAGRCR